MITIRNRGYIEKVYLSTNNWTAESDPTISPGGTGYRSTGINSLMLRCQKQNNAGFIVISWDQLIHVIGLVSSLVTKYT